MYADSYGASVPDAIVHETKHETAASAATVELAQLTNAFAEPVRTEASRSLSDWISRESVERRYRVDVAQRAALVARLDAMEVDLRTAVQSNTETKAKMDDMTREISQLDTKLSAAQQELKSCEARIEAAHRRTQELQATTTVVVQTMASAQNSSQKEKKRCVIM